jgi:hypothetical protein
MGKALLRGFLGLLVGTGIYPLLSVFVFHVRVEEGTSGCVGLITGIFFFVGTLWYDSSKRKNRSDVNFPGEDAPHFNQYSTPNTTVASRKSPTESPQIKSQTQDEIKARKESESEGKTCPNCGDSPRVNDLYCMKCGDKLS